MKCENGGALLVLPVENAVLTSQHSKLGCCFFVWCNSQDFSTSLKQSYAGNVFFGYLDSFKGRNDISGLVRKTYLYCLNDGFKGKYVLEAGRIETYREDLRAYVDMKEVRVDGEGHDKKTASSYPVGVWVYYVILLLAIILVHQVLLTIPLSLSLP